jgi:hypothetical protein
MDGTMREAQRQVVLLAIAPMNSPTRGQLPHFTRIVRR